MESVKRGQVSTFSKVIILVLVGILVIGGYIINKPTIEEIQTAAEHSDTVNALVREVKVSTQAATLCQGSWTYCQNAYADDKNLTSVQARLNTTKAGTWTFKNTPPPIQNSTLKDFSLRADAFTDKSSGFIEISLSLDNGATYGVPHRIGGNIKEQTFTINLLEGFMQSDIIAAQNLTIRANCIQRGTPGNPRCYIDYLSINQSYEVIKLVNVSISNQSSSENPCVDSDGGLDYGERGTTSGSFAITDYCSQDYPKVLFEWYCNATNQVMVESHYCSAGCNAGACNPEQPALTTVQTNTTTNTTVVNNTLNIPTTNNTSFCTDSDNGVNYYVSANIGTSNWQGTETCSGDFVNENYCSNNNLIQAPYLCPYGCLNGACKQNTTQTAPVNNTSPAPTNQTLNSTQPTTNITAQNTTTNSSSPVNQTNITGCIDTDGGINYDNPGRAYNSNLGQADYCSNTNNGAITNAVNDIYCNSAGNIAQSQFNCPAGCEMVKVNDASTTLGYYWAGKCISENTICVDSDGGLNYNTTGSVSYGSLNNQDYCGAQQSNGAQYVLEQSCGSNNQPMQVPFLCPNGCVNGKCVASNACVDSDNGLNYYTPGNVVLDGSVYGTDYCGAQLSNGTQYTFEWYCDSNGAARQQGYICPKGCGFVGSQARCNT